MIPSPSDPIALQIGPVAIPWYGVGYAVAIGFGAWLTARLARLRGLDTRHIGDALLWVIVAGVIGARLYHVIDQWQLYKDDWLKIVLPPYSGLALYGGVFGGMVGGFIYIRRQGERFLPWVDVAIPALFFGQAIARWGNFANQELYGPPTNLPWGIGIDCAHRVAAYLCPGDPNLLPGQVPVPIDAGFQPLFFYESSMTFLGGLIALFLLTRLSARLRDGDLLAFWLIWYGLLRTALETFRLSYDFTFFGLPVAIILGLSATAAGFLLLVINHLRSPVADRRAVEAGEAGEGPPAADAEDSPLAEAADSPLAEAAGPPDALT
ncbi:MAG: prolipoprotein diacylglyceryl transferase [Candidatus Limnocylindrales bacterium]